MRCAHRRSDWRIEMRILIGLAAAAAFATPAIAQPPSATLTVTPADFGSATARARFDRRVAVAIEHVCGSYATIEPYQWPNMDRCWQAARDQVNDHLGRVDSTALASREK
jgi:UrcA family protein